MNTITRALLGGIALITIGVTIGTAAPAFAADKIYPYYHGYSVKQGTPLTGEQRLQLHLYNEYEEREPCQNYRIPPVGFFRDHCTLYYSVPQPMQRVTTQETITTQTERQVIAEYNLYFDFDKAGLRPEELATLDRIAAEIDDYKPLEVTVAGHTDTSGNPDYNYNLSQRRADAVSRALTERGVIHRVIKEEAFGESRPAVDTADGVKMQENRRVEVEFLK